MSSDERRIGRIVGPGQGYGSTYYYEVQIEGETEGALYAEDDLVFLQTAPQSPISWLIDQPLVDPETFGEYFTLLKLRTRLTDVLYSFQSSRTVFRVYQFKPVLKLLSSPYQRLLIADEVGLGKTIEAGLIWSELDARMSLDRVLIVCPAGLRKKWALEMDRRFDREVTTVMSGAQVDELIERYGRRGSATRFAAIIGLEMLRTESTLAKLRDANVTFDLVVVDEAHHMRNTGTLSYEAGEFLSEAGDYLVFLTATPLNLGEPDLFNLFHLLLPEEFDDLEVFRDTIEPNQWVNLALRRLRAEYPPDCASALEALRKVEQTRQARRFLRNPFYDESVTQLESEDPMTRRRVVDLQRKITELNTLAFVYNRTRKRDLAERLAMRRAVTLNVEWTQEEWDLYSAVKAYVIARFRRLQGRGRPIGFATIMPERQASSCLHAVKDYFLNAIETGRLDLDLEEGEEDDLEVGVDSLDSETEEDTVRRLIKSADALGLTDTKLQALVDHLNEVTRNNPKAQTLIFSFFKRTLGYLERQLINRGFTVGRIDGSTPRPKREDAMEAFRRGDFQVLLSSEVGAEGLDFEFCQFMFNYDLPWNPMRLEQRIGRLDRFGQQHDVIFVGNFHIPGTIDSDIFERLYDRIGIFERSIGELEPILGSAIRQLQQTILRAELSPEEQQRQTDRIAHAIEEKAVALEEFEKDRERLVGNDEYLVEQLENVERNRQYITGEELQRLFQGYLRRVLGKTGHVLKPDADDPRILYFSASIQFADAIRRHLREHDPAALDLLSSLEAGAGLTLTFDAQAAYQRKAEFLNLRHPFMRAIIAYYEESETLQRAGRIEMDADADGDYLFFVFLFHATGLVPRVVLSTIAVDLAEQAVHEQIGDLVLPNIARREVRDVARKEALPTETVETCYHAAMSWAVNRKEEWQTEIARTNEAIAVSRQESLLQSLDVRSRRVAALAAGATNPRIRTMRESQLRNLQQRIQARLRELESKKKVTVSIQPLAGGYLRTVAATSPTG